MFRKFLYILSLPLVIFSCNDEGIEDTVSYSRILEDGSYNNGFQPVAIKETGDGGAIIISAVNDDPESYPRVTVIKIDNEGLWESETPLPAGYVSPANGLVEIDSVFYFFCMDENSYRAYLVSIDQEGVASDPIPAGGAPSFPLATGIVNDNIALLSYDAQDKRTVVSLHATAGNQVGSIAYTIGEGSDADPLILAHFAQRKSRLPFAIGETADGTAYFNGLYNFSLALVFTNLGQNPSGVVQGQGDEGGISALLPLSNGSFALSGFQYESNFIRPEATVNTTGVSSSINFLDRDIPEIKSNSSVKIIEYTLNENNYTVFAVETESRQIGLYFYEGQNLVATEYVGYLNGFNLGDITITDDNSILILASTYTAGRFERLFVRKIAEERIDEIINP